MALGFYVNVGRMVTVIDLYDIVAIVEMINVKRKKIGEDMMMCIYIKIYKVMGKGRIVVCV